MGRHRSSAAVSHVLHTVIVSYNRLPLLKQTLDSYYQTVTLPFNLVIVDNGSDFETTDYLRHTNHQVIYLDSNMYPGFATNHGFALASSGATLLHRSDNDIEYLPGWCDEVAEKFDLYPILGQLGLRTLEEEGPHAAVGGNCVIRRELWEQGLRYSENPWTPNTPFEDGLMASAIRRLGSSWARVERPCVIHRGLARSDDPYYQRTFADRGIGFAEYGIA